MPLRTRSRSSSQIGGQTWHESDPAGTLTTQVYTSFFEETEDYVGRLFRPDGSMTPAFFEKDATYRDPPTFSRPNPSGTNWAMIGRLMLENLAVGSSGYTPPGSARNAENQILATRLMARTHPFTPVYSVPVAIKELVEVSSMFSLAMKSWIGYIGNSYLNYRFGWVAFVNDIRTLSTLTEEIEARFREFNYLLEHGYTRKKLVLSKTGGNSLSKDAIIHSTYGITIFGDHIRTWTQDVWGSVVWGLSGDKLIPVDDLSRWNLAVRSALDLEKIDPSTMWEMVPFSWLVDYFSNVGDLLASQHLRYQIQPYDICIMRHYVQNVEVRPTIVPSHVSSTTRGKYRREIKTRDVVQPPTRPSLAFDLLRGDRWKVILALIAKFSSP